MAGMVASGVYDMVLGSRILGAGALKGGMPLYKYVANRFLTAIQNLFLGVKLSEYHTGFRAFSRELLETLPLLENSDDFVFDNQMIAQMCIRDSSLEAGNGEQKNLSSSTHSLFPGPHFLFPTDLQLCAGELPLFRG